ncbi:hypothetical protein L284_14815 [Novosphingobium lindaniclasticum LE124]|uniref:Uncharacterized protein n=1 Tax=Novosphingobium lindaniclasticum LE124 TaxID=1096930 RepID=T0H9K7_9SPHN|nr:hypothetical protein L284_14815 [Novosphingobium lindaniclasticum LE124]
MTCLGVRSNFDAESIAQDVVKACKFMGRKRAQIGREIFPGIVDAVDRQFLLAVKSIAAGPNRPKIR